MRWLCFLLLANPYPLTAQASPKPLRFDLEGLTAKRDSFVFFLRGAERGYAVWQYEIRPLEMTQRILYTARSEFRPVEQESLRVVLNRLTGEPIATFHHIDLFSPTSDTIMVEHDLEVKRGEIGGRRRRGRRGGEGGSIPARRPLPRGPPLSDYIFFAAPVANAAPRHPPPAPAHREFGHSNP